METISAVFCLIFYLYHNLLTFSSVVVVVVVVVVIVVHTTINHETEVAHIIYK